MLPTTLGPALRALARRYERLATRSTVLPATRLVRSRLARGPVPSPWDVAAHAWQIAPAHEAEAPPAIALPDQLARVTGWVFGSEADQRRDLAGGAVLHAPTRACVLRGAYLLDGTVHAGPARECLQPRTRLWPGLRVHAEIERGALACSFPGNRWFGMWLMDDCPRYALAAAEGKPVTTIQAPSPHMRTYEHWLDMQPLRERCTYFRELVLFDDTGQNPDKRARFAAMRARLRARVGGTRHAGVFLVRGLAGERRVLDGELELAERLRERRGFLVIDPLAHDLETVLRACAGAAVVMGVEGSALMHGLAVLEPGAALVTLQPPDRFCSLYKHLTDRDGQRFAYVVGHPTREGFAVDPDSVERTLDLLS